MARVKRGNVARKRRNKILRLARGFRGGNGTLFRTANQRVMKALCNAYRDRRRRKRDFRRLWIARICLLYTSPSPRDLSTSRMPSSA